MTPIPCIEELKAKSNAEAPREVWVATAQWLASHDLAALTQSAPATPSIHHDRAAWVDLWRPFWRARKRVPHWLPRVPHDEWRWHLESLRS